VTNQIAALVLKWRESTGGRLQQHHQSHRSSRAIGSLRVQSMATNPTNITAVVSGNQYNLSWPISHTRLDRLQAQTNSFNVGLEQQLGDRRRFDHHEPDQCADRPGPWQRFLPSRKSVKLKT
jgi:hypothetical protein